MATTATIYRFQVDLSDIDRGVYETLDLRVARHASEEEDRLVVRVLARVLAHEEGMEFGRGLSEPNDAAIWTRDLTGQLMTWVDVGVPSADRLHRASKACSAVHVFTHKSDPVLLKEWRTRKIHRASNVKVHRIEPDFVNQLAETLDRRVTWYVTIQDHELSVNVGDRVLEGTVEETDLEAFCSTAEGT